MIHSKQHRGCRSQDPGTRGYPVVENSRLFAQRGHSARCAPTNRVLCSGPVKHVTLDGSVLPGPSFGCFHCTASCPFSPSGVDHSLVSAYPRPREAFRSRRRYPTSGLQVL